jgi:DNA integrity scanning protein DisA with diadenylate cyclase activity
VSKTSHNEHVDPAAETPPVSASRITRTMLEHAGEIADACQAAAVFVYADVVQGAEVEFPEGFPAKVYRVTSRPDDQNVEAVPNSRVLRVPDVPLTRTAQVKMAAFLALSRGLVHRGDTVVFVSGTSSSGTLDTILVLQLGREFEMFATGGEDEDEAVPVRIQPEVIERVVDLASELSSEGREGKPVGTMFVIGDPDQILPLTRQLVLNPFRGYAENVRNILDPTLGETVKELASIDGAFIIRGDGIIESCGTYLKTASQEEYELPQGLGARHHAAAESTSVTPAIAVTVSESTGTIGVFRGGRMVTEIEKPRASIRTQAMYRGQRLERGSGKRERKRSSTSGSAKAGPSGSDKGNG